MICRVITNILLRVLRKISVNIMVEIKKINFKIKNILLKYRSRNNLNITIIYFLLKVIIIAMHKEKTS